MTEYTANELMICVAARLMEDGTTAFIGTGIPMLAAALAFASTELLMQKKSLIRLKRPSEALLCVWNGQGGAFVLNESSSATKITSSGTIFRWDTRNFR